MVIAGGEGRSRSLIRRRYRSSLDGLSRDCYSEKPPLELEQLLLLRRPAQLEEEEEELTTTLLQPRPRIRKQCGRRSLRGRRGCRRWSCCCCRRRGGGSSSNKKKKKEIELEAEEGGKRLLVEVEGVVAKKEK